MNKAIEDGGGGEVENKAGEDQEGSYSFKAKCTKSKHRQRMDVLMTLARSIVENLNDLFWDLPTIILFLSPSSIPEDADVLSPSSIPEDAEVTK